MQATLPYFVEWAERETIRQNNSSAAVKHELTIYSTVCVEMKALVNCCDILARLVYSTHYVCMIASSSIPILKYDFLATS